MEGSDTLRGIIDGKIALEEQGRFIGLEGSVCTSYPKIGVMIKIFMIFELNIV